VEKIAREIGREFKKVGERVGENEAKIFNLISRDNRITYVELSTKLNITEKSVYKNIKTLKKKGLLKRVDSAKGGHWEVIE